MSESNLIDDEYFGGLFDAEGCVELAFQEKNLVVHPKLNMGFSNKYFAGLFDGDGSVSLNFNEDKKKLFGIKVGSLHVLINFKHSYSLLKAIQDKYGGHIHRTETYNRWDVNKHTEVEEVVDVLLNHCIIKRPQLLIMKHIVIPMIKEGEHLTLGGLRLLIDIHNNLNISGNSVKKDWLKILTENIQKKIEMQYPNKGYTWTLEDTKSLKCNYDDKYNELINFLQQQDTGEDLTYLSLPVEKKEIPVLDEKIVNDFIKKIKVK